MASNTHAGSHRESVLLNTDQRKTKNRCPEGLIHKTDFQPGKGGTDEEMASIQRMETLWKKHIYFSDTTSVDAQYPHYHTTLG